MTTETTPWLMNNSSRRMFKAMVLFCIHLDGTRDNPNDRPFPNAAEVGFGWAAKTVGSRLSSPNVAEVSFRWSVKTPGSRTRGPGQNTELSPAIIVCLLPRYMNHSFRESLHFL